MSGLDSERAAPGRYRAQVLRNVLTNWGAFVLNAGIAFVISPYVVRTLGSDAYGVWVLVGSLVGYLGLLDVGVRGAVTKYVATHHAASAHDEASRLTSAGLSFFGAAGVGAVLVSAIVAYGFLPFFEVPDDLRPVASLVLVLSGVNIGVALVSGVFGGVIVGVQRFDRLNVITMLAAVLRALATVAALELGTGLVGLAVVQLAVSVLQGAASLVMSRAVYPELRFGRRDWNRAHLGSLLSFGVATTLILAAGMVIDYSDSLVIGAFLDVGSITPFAIAATLCFYTRQVISGISHTVAPMAGALDGRRDVAPVRQMILVGSRLATLVIAPIVVVLLLRGGSFIGLWMGPQYAEGGGSVLAVLAVYVYAFAGFQVLTSAMIGLDRHRGMVPAFALEAVVNIGLSIVLVRSLGIVGVAWGTTLPRLVTCLVFGPLYARRQLGVGVLGFWTQSLIRPTLAVVPFALLTGWVEARWRASSLVVFALQVLAVLPVALLGAWLFSLNAGERRGAWSTLQGALGLRARGAASG